MNLKITSITLLLLFIIKCEDKNNNFISSEKSYYSISGYIYDSIFKTPIDSVHILNFDESQSTQSDLSGYYEITGLHSGKYKFLTHKNGYHDDSLTVTVADSDLTQQSKYLRPFGLFAVTSHNEYCIDDTITLQIFNYTDYETFFRWMDFRLIHFLELKNDNVWQNHSSWIGGFNSLFKSIHIKQDSIYFERYMLWPPFDGMEEGLYRLKFPFNWNDFINGVTDSLFSNEFSISKIN